MYRRMMDSTPLKLTILLLVVAALALVVVPALNRMSQKSRAIKATSTVEALLTAQWIYYNESRRFTPYLGELLIDIDRKHFVYDVAIDHSAIEITVEGRSDTLYNGIRVKGDINGQGRRKVLEPTVS